MQCSFFDRGSVGHLIVLSGFRSRPAPVCDAGRTCSTKTRRQGFSCPRASPSALIATAANYQFSLIIHTAWCGLHYPVTCLSCQGLHWRWRRPWLWRLPVQWPALYYCCEARALAFAACGLSSTGYLSPGSANADLGSAFLLRVVNFDISPPFAQWCVAMAIKTIRDTPGRPLTPSWKCESLLTPIY